MYLKYKWETTNVTAIVIYCVRDYLLIAKHLVSTPDKNIYFYFYFLKFFEISFYPADYMN